MPFMDANSPNPLHQPPPKNVFLTQVVDKSSEAPIRPKAKMRVPKFPQSPQPPPMYCEHEWFVVGIYFSN